MNRGYIEVDDKYYSIQPISDDYSTEGHVVYTKANEELFDKNVLNKNLDAAEEITQRTDGWIYFKF